LASITNTECTSKGCSK